MANTAFKSFAQENGGRVIVLFLLFLLAIYQFVNSGFPAFAVICAIPLLILLVITTFRYRLFLFWALVIINYLVSWRHFPLYGLLPTSLYNEAIELVLLAMVIIDVKGSRFERLGNIYLFSWIIWCGFCTLEVLNDTCGIGIDVARFGIDNSVITKRKGLCVLDIQKVHGYNTQEVAGLAWEMAGRDISTLIKIDIGYNQGVYDLLNEWGANVVPVNFGGKATNEIYANCAAEMMCELPLKNIYIPKELLSQTLLEDLSERQYYYNSRGQKQLEPKDNRSDTAKSCFKNRHNGRSPDEGDSLCLAFYEKRNDMCY